MKKLLLTGTGMLAAAFGCVLLAQQAPEKKFNMTVALNQDAFFGFYPTINASMSLTEKADLTFYSILWTTPSFGTGGGGGLWTEFGAGANFKVAKGALTINPSLGFTNGKLLSNGNYAVAFEGLVPSVTSNLSTKRFEGQFYLGYYAAIKKGKVRQSGGEYIDAPLQNNFLHYWLNAGIKTNGPLSFGAHFEHLVSNPSVGKSSDAYQWIGPYVQFSTPKGHGLRFTGGADVTSRTPDTEQNSFYKLSAFFNL